MGIVGAMDELDHEPISLCVMPLTVWVGLAGTPPCTSVFLLCTPRCPRSKLQAFQVVMKSIFVKKGARNIFNLTL